jgi:plasmid stabilization system protein ParE
LTHSLRFLPEVADDVLAAHDWYERKDAGLGSELLRVFYARASEIPHNPLRHQKVHHDFRRSLLRRFPYAIYFRVEGPEVVVYGLFHCARDPSAIRAQIQKRDEPDGMK